MWKLFIGPLFNQSSRVIPLTGRYSRRQTFFMAIPTEAWYIHNNVFSDRISDPARVPMNQTDEKEGTAHDLGK